MNRPKKPRNVRLKTRDFGISISRVRKLVCYDPDEGVVRFVSGWREGRIGGTLQPDGYLRIMLAGVNFPVAWICWVLFYDAWPRQELDHINRIKCDNRIKNLREVTRSQNMRNRRYAESGFKGVYKNGKNWRAQVFENGTTRHLGTFLTRQAASAAYLQYRGGEL